MHIFLCILFKIGLRIFCKKNPYHFPFSFATHPGILLMLGSKGNTSEKHYSFSDRYWVLDLINKAIEFLLVFHYRKINSWKGKNSDKFKTQKIVVG